VCKDRFKIIEDGTCEKCPDYEVTTIDLKGCERPTYCDVRERITREGLCEECPEYHRTFVPKGFKDGQLLPPGFNSQNDP